jgi:prepilin-type N-terminal cleavage/methylation domain-containing protein
VTRPTVRDDRGFTLIELVASIAILSVIIAAITTAMIVFLKTGGEASRRDDHSSGAATAASYLNRDLASANTATTAPSTSCSGKANRLVLTWVDFVATPANPSPSPAALSMGYTAAYAVTSDPDSSATDGAPRFQLERWYCAPGVAKQSSILVRDIFASTDVTASSVASGQCPGGRFTVTIKRYAQDTGADYASDGCLQGRTR